MKYRFESPVHILVSDWSDWSKCARSTTNNEFTKDRTRTCLNGATCTDILSEQDTCSFEVWHGETDIADYTVGSVNSWKSEWFQPEMMFDNPPKPSGVAEYSDGQDTVTLWMSEPCQTDPTNCLITITFQVIFFNLQPAFNFFQTKINFHHLTIAKRQWSSYNDDIIVVNREYKNACLTLDGDDDNKLCAPEEYGFDESSNLPPYEIDFILPKENVKTIQLSFAGEGPPDQAGNVKARISDMKILYENTGK